jgi:hypothetical protein
MSATHHSNGTIKYAASGDTLTESVVPKSAAPRVPDPGRAVALRRAAELELMQDLLRELSQR